MSFHKDSAHVNARPLWYKDDCFIVGVNGVLHCQCKTCGFTAVVGFDLRVLETLTVVEQLFLLYCMYNLPLVNRSHKTTLCYRNVSCQNNSASNTFL